MLGTVFYLRGKEVKMLTVMLNVSEVKVEQQASSYSKSVYVTCLCVCSPICMLTVFVREKILFMFVPAHRDTGGVPGTGQGWERLHLKTGAGRGHALTGLHAQRGGACHHYAASGHGW